MNTAQKQRIEFLRGKGESYAAIAEELGISENTIKSYCRRNSIGIAIKQEYPHTDAVSRNDIRYESDDNVKVEVSFIDLTNADDSISKILVGLFPHLSIEQ